MILPIMATIMVEVAPGAGALVAVVCIIQFGQLSPFALARPPTGMATRLANVHLQQIVGW